MTLQRHLVIFARAPQRGAVKRRLAADIGDSATISFYNHTLQTTLHRLAPDRRWRTWLSVTPDSAAGGHLAGLFEKPLSCCRRFQSLSRRGTVHKLQVQSTFGNRLRWLQFYQYSVCVLSLLVRSMKTYPRSRHLPESRQY